MKVVVPDIRNLGASESSLVLDTTTLEIQEMVDINEEYVYPVFISVHESSGRLTEFVRSGSSNSFYAVVDGHELRVAIVSDGIYVGNKLVYETRDVKKYSVSYLFAYKSYIVIRFSGTDGVMSLAVQYSNTDRRWLCKGIWTDDEEDIGTVLTTAIDTGGRW